MKSDLLSQKKYHKVINDFTGQIVADKLTERELNTFFRCPSNFNQPTNKYKIETYYKNRIWKWIDSIQFYFVMCTLSFLLGYLMYKIINDLII